MSLELPAALEPHVGTDFQTSAVYALLLDRPDDLEARLGEHYPQAPPWLSQAVGAEALLYVGAAARLCDRLEDHATGRARRVGLLEVCEIDRVYDVWAFEDRARAFERESAIALELQNDHDGWYVHQR